MQQESISDVQNQIEQFTHVVSSCMIAPALPEHSKSQQRGVHYLTTHPLIINTCCVGLDAIDGLLVTVALIAIRAEYIRTRRRRTSSSDIAGRQCNNRAQSRYYKSCTPFICGHHVWPTHVTHVDFEDHEVVRSVDFSGGLAVLHPT